MNPGDILLFKAEKGFSKIIAWGTGSKYSHVAICVSSDMNLAIESVPGGGVRAADIRKINVPYDVFRVREGNLYNLGGVVSFLIDKLNDKYDYLGVAWLGIIKIFSKMHARIKNAANKWQKDRDYFCSELCYAAFQIGGGLDIVPDVKDADITSPGDIALSRIIERITA